MHPRLKILLIGLGASFVGTLPLGTLNVAAMEISAANGVPAALRFTVGCLLVEMLYVLVSLEAMDWFRRRRRFVRVFEWGALVMVVGLAGASIYAALHPGHGRNVVLDSALPKFWLGMAMSAVNPAQVPYWAGWSLALMANQVLLPRRDWYVAYVAGIGLGTLAGTGVFIFGGALLINSFDGGREIVSWLVAGGFSVAALLQLGRLHRRKGYAES